MDRNVNQALTSAISKVLVAVDVATAADAFRLVETLQGAVGGFKIGKQLFTAEGPEVVRKIAAAGHRVFLDLKYHDIPNTVAGAVAAAAHLGVWMVNVHASGGPRMMAAARKAAEDAGALPGMTRPLVIGVTVLTSLDAVELRAIGIDRSPIDHAVQLARLAKDSGLDGVVASPQETAAIRSACGPGFLIVTPGIRGGSAASGPDDQQRTSTPSGAIEAGSSYLVIGRPITAAKEPRQTALAIADDLGSISQ